MRRKMLKIQRYNNERDIRIIFSGLIIQLKLEGKVTKGAKTHNNAQGALKSICGAQGNKNSLSKQGLLRHYIVEFGCK